MNHNPAIRQTAGKCAAAAAVLGAAVGLAVCGGISPDKITEYTQKNPLPAALLFLLLYAIKSATVVFPLLVLQAAVGFLYPLPGALAINFAGMLVILTVPYWIGRRRGAKYVDWALARYPKLGFLAEKQRDHSFFLCFFLRVIGELPCDAITMYLGAAGISFWQNLVGGSFGILPGMVLATVMGTSLEDPSSPAFWISALLSVGLAGISAAVYFLYMKHQRRKEAPR